MRRALVGLAAVGLAVLPVAARAAEITDVASSFDDDHPFGMRLRLGYDHLEKRAAIKRELEGSGFTQIATLKDLLYSQSRDTLALRLEVGLYQDLAVHVALPLVLGDSRELGFDQSLGSGCTFANQATRDNPASCVNADNSTTIADGIVPAGGYDAQAGGMMFPAGSTRVFRGPQRGGGGDVLDTLDLGITWAPLNQRRDDTKPTWTVELEGRISIAPTVMKFDRARPDANHSVSEGLHHLIARTAVSKRFCYFDPYIGFWYALPFTRDDSLFIDYGPTQKSKEPQQSAGTIFGVEGIPWEQADHEYRVGIQLQGRIEAHFDGRGYSEVWEMLAGAEPLDCKATFNPSCNLNNPYMGRHYTGLTTIENYATLGADVGLFVQAGRHARLHLGFRYSHDQSHFLTIDDVGRASDCDGVASTGRVTKACEFNPAYRQVINQVGRRYKVDNESTYDIGVWGQLMF